MPILLHTRTGICRSFKSYDLAFMWVHERREHEKYIFTGPDDFNWMSSSDRKVLYPLLEDWADWRWRGRGKPQKSLIPYSVFADRSREGQNGYFWRAVNDIADPVTVSPHWISGGGVIIDLDKCNELLLQKKWVSLDVKAPHLPPRERYPAHQMVDIVKALRAKDETYMTEETLEKFIRSYSVTKILDTRQDNWRIFRYYRPVLEQLGVLR